MAVVILKRRFLIGFIFFFFLINNINAETISLNSNWEYANFAVIKNGSAQLYRSSNGNGKVVGINAGHGTSGGEQKKVQVHPDGSPKIVSGSTSSGSTTASAVSSGMTFNDGTPEATVTLRMANILKDQLLAAGYDVLMLRSGADVQLDNIARTVIANNVADIHISLHWDSTKTDKGVFFMSVPNDSSYISMDPVKDHWQEHNRLGNTIIDAMKKENIKIFGNGSMAMDLVQTSYSTIPSIDLELGDKVSNVSDANLQLLAKGVLKGINNYFGDVSDVSQEKIDWNNSDLNSDIEDLLNVLMASWPSSIERGRVDVIKKAASLIDKGIVYPSVVGGGATVTSQNPSSLDCSDYVSWSFYNAGFTSVGDWCTGTFVNSDLFEEITKADLQPGDIALNSKNSSCTGSSNHIGIYVGQKNSQNVYFHSSNSGGVSGPQVRYGEGNFKVYYRFKDFGSGQVNTNSYIQNTGLREDPYPYNGFKQFQTGSLNTCHALLATNDGELNDFGEFLQGLFTLIKIAAPVLVIALSTIDYIKALTASNADEMKKVTQRTIKRVVVGLIVFFLPFLLDVLFHLFGLYDIGTCGIGAG